MMKQSTVAILIFFLTVPFVGAKSDEPVSAVFLELPPGARPIALGEAMTASGDDPYTIFYNPAGMAERPSAEVTFNRYNFFTGLEYDYLAGLLPIGRLGHLGASFTYVGLSTSGRDIFGRETGTFRTKDIILDFSYAKKLVENFNIGGSFKFAHEDLHDFKQSLFAFDLGAFYRIPLGINRNINLAFSIRNLGRVLPVDATNAPLPFVATLGASVQPTDFLKLYTEVYLPEHSDQEVGGGVEYTYRGMFSVRGGFRWSPDMSGNEIFRGGFGLKVGNFGDIDYAYRSRENYRGEHRFSFTTRFGPGSLRSAY